MKTTDNEKAGAVEPMVVTTATDHAYNPGLGTVEYFRSEVMSFRKYMGMKSFWADPERAGAAMFGLLYVWTHTEKSTERDNILMQATSVEYDRRLAHAVMCM